jgi:hypothetical protein
LAKACACGLAIITVGTDKDGEESASVECLPQPGSARSAGIISDKRRRENGLLAWKAQESVEFTRTGIPHFVVGSVLSLAFASGVSLFEVLLSGLKYLLSGSYR